MAASINDKFNQATTTSRPVPAVLTAVKANGASSITVDSTTGWPTDTAVHFTIYQVDANGDRVEGTQIDCKGIVNSSTSINNITVKAGTDAEYPIGSKVVCAPTAAWADDVVEGIAVEHNQDGTHAFTQVEDTNGNELIKLSETASAVNEITLRNAATSTAPQIQATGDDSNIDLNLVPKGTGEVTKAGNPIDWWEEIGRTTLGSAGDTITVSSLPARKFLKIIVSVVATGGSTSLFMRFNNDSGTNYTYRESSNGAADSTSTGATSIALASAANGLSKVDAEIVNVAAQEKMVMVFGGQTNTAGTGNIPTRRELSGKWVNTSAQISQVDVVNGGAGDYAIGSEVVVLGHD